MQDTVQDALENTVQWRTGRIGVRMAADDGVATGLVVVLIAIGVALVLFCLSALVSILRTPGMPPGHRLGWVVAVLILQFFAPLAWFTVGRSRYRNS